MRNWFRRMLVEWRPGDVTRFALACILVQWKGWWALAAMPVVIVLDGFAADLSRDGRRRRMQKIVRNAWDAERSLSADEWREWRRLRETL